MIEHANRQLRRMTDRYLLLRNKEQPLELDVIDGYQAGEIRSTKNLSGGESFIVSLALALGLSQMASKTVRWTPFSSTKGSARWMRIRWTPRWYAGRAAPGRQAHRRDFACGGLEGAHRDADTGHSQNRRPQRRQRPRLLFGIRHGLIPDNISPFPLVREIGTFSGGQCLRLPQAQKSPIHPPTS